jgi:hypothetical protein
MKCPHCKLPIQNLQVAAPPIGAVGSTMAALGPIPRVLAYIFPKCDTIIETAVLAQQPARV